MFVLSFIYVDVDKKLTYNCRLFRPREPGLEPYGKETVLELQPTETKFFFLYF